MKIQSISDIITNSSSEVFTIYSEESLKAVKELVNSILELAGDRYNFDDYFDIDFAIDSSRIDDMKDLHPEITDEAELKKMVLEEYNHSIESGEGSWGVEGIIVTAKDPKCKKAAELIANIENIFDHEEMYC